MNNAETNFRQKRIISNGRRSNDVTLLRYVIKVYLGEMTKEEALSHMCDASYYNYRTKIKDFLNDKNSKLRNAEKNLLIEYRDSLKEAQSKNNTYKTVQKITTKVNYVKCYYGIYDQKNQKIIYMHSSEDFIRGYYEAIRNLDLSIVKLQMEYLSV